MASSGDSASEPKGALRNKYQSEAQSRRSSQKKLELEMQQTGSTTSTTEKLKASRRTGSIKKKKDDEVNSEIQSVSSAKDRKLQPCLIMPSCLLPKGKRAQGRC